MSMYLTIDINDKTLHSVTVTNRGPAAGEYIPGDGPGGDGPRLYHWQLMDSPLSGQLIHTRERRLRRAA